MYLPAMPHHLSQMTHDLQNVDRFKNQVVLSSEKTGNGAALAEDSTSPATCRR